jgi:hypothetical protein
MPNTETWSPRVLAILRIITALLFLEHATVKFFHFPMAMPGLPPSLPPMLIVAGTIEIVTSVLIISGPVHANGGFRRLGRDGGRLLDGARAAGLLAGAEPGRAGDPVLLHLPLSGRRGPGRLEPRRGAQEANTGAHSSLALAGAPGAVDSVGAPSHSVECHRRLVRRLAARESVADRQVRLRRRSNRPGISQVEGPRGQRHSGKRTRALHASHRRGKFSLASAKADESSQVHGQRGHWNRKRPVAVDQCCWSLA